MRRIFRPGRPYLAQLVAVLIVLALELRLMERRLAGRTSSPFFLTGPAMALVLAVTMMVVTGPGASASRAPTASPTRQAPAAADMDPVGALAWDLEYDVDRIFRYVADEIRYEPYPGILRGATGTLEARAGNSADKALLLAALLDASLVPYRFARGPLDQATTAELLDSLATDLDGARQIARDPLVRGLDQVRAAGEALRPADSGRVAEIEREASAVEAEGTKRLEATRARLTDTVTMIEDGLRGAGIDLPSGTAMSLPPAETTAHTWVQRAYGSAWVDLDPTVAGAQPGAVLARPAETLPELPDDTRHAIEFGVLVESVSGGQLATTEVLTYAGYADELAETPVTFTHVTPSGLKALGSALGDLLGEGWIDYRPALFVGDRTFVADDAVAFPLGGGARDGGSFDEAFGHAASPSPGSGPSEGEATAEWLEVRVTSPGSEPEVMRRTVFDRLSADLRVAGELTPSAIAPIEFVDDGTGSTDFPPMLGLRTFAIATGPTTAASVAAVSQDELGMAALAYHTVRDAISAAVALDAGARTFIDGPNIVSLTIEPDWSGPDPIARLGLDIWRRDHGVLPLTMPSGGSARSELIAGVLDHMAERFALEGLAGGDEAGAPVAETGVGAVFEAAANQGIGTLTLQGSVPDTLPFGPVPMRLIREAVASGDVVIVPGGPVTVGGRDRVGWWRVDPRTGVTTDVMDDGSGQSMGEYVEIVDAQLGRLVCHGLYARRVAFLIVVAATAVGAYGYTDIFWRYEDGYQGLQCSAG